jgi:NitT/TauT family transport system permease protein
VIGEARVGGAQTATSEGLKTVAGALAVVAVVFLLWTAASSTRAVASPIGTLQVLVSAVGEGWIARHLWATFNAVGVGFALALVLGVGLGAFLGASVYWRAVLDPVVMALYSVPKITLYPVLILFLGLGAESRVAMALIHAIFPVIIATMTGVREVSPTLVKLARVLQANPFQTLTKLYLPAIAPGLVAGARMGFSLAIIGVVLAELFASKAGMGFLIREAYGQFNLERMLALILFLFGIAFATNTLFWGFERRLRR